MAIPSQGSDVNFASLMGAAGGDPDRLKQLMNIFSVTQQGKNMMRGTQTGFMGNLGALQGSGAQYRPPAPQNIRPGSRMGFQRSRNRGLAGI
ncbi:hypothetical protein LCGC14_0926770 [marine sediment metagenome]|uniref:Uncharacterized protein n=1 Tax=marine sediment metagenome TaxID=412755 RepID=A0A0F9NTX3_9ZZZZ